MAPVMAAPQALVIDNRATQAAFDVASLGFFHIRGVFQRVEGLLFLDESGHLTGLDVHIDTSSLTTATPDRDAYLKGSDFFDVAHYPDATVTADGLNLKADLPLDINGYLTLRGVTRPVVLTLTALDCPDPDTNLPRHCHGQVETTIKRSEWGMRGYLPLVSDKVHIRVEVVADAN